jgi:hypothetical protein
MVLQAAARRRVARPWCALTDLVTAIHQFSHCADRADWRRSQCRVDAAVKFAQ